MPSKKNESEASSHLGNESLPLFELAGANKQGKLNAKSLLDALAKSGIQSTDPRLKGLWEDYPELAADGISLKTFEGLLGKHNLVRNALNKKLCIPDWEEFTSIVVEILETVKKDNKGKVADYIPQLARVNPDYFACSICTIDGQRFSYGDAQMPFCLQSTCKPVNYSIAIENLGETVVHKHVGREPSGRSFNELSLNNAGLPHNPLINSGAIMCVSLIEREKDMADRFDSVTQTWKRLCASPNINFNNAVYLSERQTADRNFALAYFMREKKAFPEQTDIVDTLEFYFQCCSIEVNAVDMAVAASTLANGGVNPLNGDRIFRELTVQHALSLMLSCGMYDFSGEFAFKIGLPAKSGVSGALMVVVPNVMGIVIWSPCLDELGNSYRGVAFCEELVKRFNFHHYDSLVHETNKTNPRRRNNETRINNIVHLIWAATNGDLDEIRRLESEGMDLSQADYDGRTALHLAASENQLEVVDFLIQRKVPIEPIDRWGGKPIEDAERAGHKEIVALLKNAK